MRPLSDGAVRGLVGASSAIVLLQVDSERRVVGWNAEAASRFSLGEAGATRLEDLLVAHEAERWRTLVEADPAPATVDAHFVDRHQHPVTLRCRLHRDGDILHVLGESGADQEASLSRTLMAVNQELAVLSREHARRSRELAEAKAELERTLEDLRTAYWHLEKVQEVISVCMRCGKIKADEATWESLGDYMLRNEILLSHGYCPDCGRAWEKEIDEALGP